jgi:NADP-dependent alcohol dehydrogenase
MQNFTFYNPVRVLFGAGQIGCLPREIPEGVKVLMTYGPTAVAASSATVCTTR